MFHKILLAADDSPPAKAAFDFAMRLAGQLGAKLTVLHVVESERVPVGAPPDGGFRTVLEGWCKEVPGKAAAPEVVLISDAAPTQGILDQLKSMRWDFVVLGTHGRKGAQRALLGSVADAVMRQSPVPVTVVRGAP